MKSYVLLTYSPNQPSSEQFKLDLKTIIAREFPQLEVEGSKKHFFINHKKSLFIRDITLSLMQGDLKQAKHIQSGFGNTIQYHTIQNTPFIEMEYDYNCYSIFHYIINYILIELALLYCSKYTIGDNDWIWLDAHQHYHKNYIDFFASSSSLTMLPLNSQKESLKHHLVFLLESLPEDMHNLIGFQSYYMNLLHPIEGEI